MHGMAKSKASEAEKEKKRREKEEKAKEYLDGMKKIFEKRKNLEFDDEALSLMSDLLVSHPDVYTLWNFRKEILLKFKEEKDEEFITTLVASEMRLTEMCLRANPKSYCAWYHRLWLLDNLPKADLETELMICNKYLKLDSRNFHGWDYRREVVRKLEISTQEELNYTMSKIEENFSNYSSWHYRSKLLPKAYEDPTGVRPIKEEIHVQELDLVQNAAFTDPTDSSAWFYLRWLLGRLEPKLFVISCFIKNNNLFITFSRCPNSDDDISVEINGQIFSMEKIKHLWVGSLDVENETEIKVNLKIVQNQEILLNKQNGFFYFMKPQFEPDVSKKLLSVLNEQLESCNQLIELEPDSKWTLLTSVVLMQGIDKSKYNNEILDRISLLSKIDFYRTNYYSDTRSRFLIENKLEDWDPSKIADLSNLCLSGLYHTQYLSCAVKVNLSMNKLQEKSLPLLKYLVNCEELDLSGNDLTSLKGFPNLKSLRSLNVSQNKIGDPVKIFSYVKNLNNLKELNLSQNLFKKNTHEENIPGLTVIF